MRSFRRFGCFNSNNIYHQWSCTYHLFTNHLYYCSMEIKDKFYLCKCSALRCNVCNFCSIPLVHDQQFDWHRSSFTCFTEGANYILLCFSIARTCVFANSKTRSEQRHVFYSLLYYINLEFRIL